MLEPGWFNSRGIVIAFLAELAKEIDEIKSEVAKINKKLNDLARILQN